MIFVDSTKVIYDSWSNSLECGGETILLFDYKELKKSIHEGNTHGLPTWDAFLPVVLATSFDKDLWSGKELKYSAIKRIKNLPKNMLNIRINPTDHYTALENRAQFALSLLTNSGLISRPERSIYSPNKSGEQIFQKLGNRLTEKDVKALDAYQKYKNIGNVDQPQEDNIISDLTPEEQMTEVVNSNKAAICTDLLRKIQEKESTYFEGLVVDLLVKMGYQGKNGNSIVTKRSGDGGVDGIINQDPLGTQTVYIQAKRYKDGNNIQVAAIREFNSAVQIAHGNKGVFITTSDFSQGAKNEAKQFGLVLINGIELTNLMIQYKLGVRVKKSFELLDIDEDFFEE